MTNPNPRHWELLVADKRAAILAAIPQEYHIPSPPPPSELRDVTGYIQTFLTEKEKQITQSSAVQIAERVRKGEWSAEEVARSFCHVAGLAHQLLNCLHEVFFDAAIADARALDAYFKQYSKTIGPLHGVPVSLKDQFHVKDVETTMGYVGWMGTFEGKSGTGKEKVFESEMVTMLRKAGAVLYCKTSVPHTLMCGETMNNIIGYTLNPKNRGLSSGGSSGGEGALIGCGGSPLGFGTDIGGSIRIPATYNGFYGLRPSTGRLPYSGMANSMDGQTSVLSVVGPLAPDVPTLRLATKTLLDQKPWLLDPLVHEMPWREDHHVETIQRAKEGGLVFGLLSTDRIVNPMPPVRRALIMLQEALEAAGHEVIPWSPPSHDILNTTAYKTWRYDGGTDIRHAFSLSGEPPSSQVAFLCDPRAEVTASDVAATNVELRTLRKAYLDYWTSTAAQTRCGRMVDAVICPLAPWPAARPGEQSYYGYSVWVNALDYTGIAVPVTRVDKGVDGRFSEYRALSELDEKVQKLYDPEIYDGAHVGVQIVGRRLTEESTLAVAEYVGGLVRK